jgi:hypothetical protein
MRLTSLAVALSLVLTFTGLAATVSKSQAPAKKTAPVKKGTSSATKKAAPSTAKRKVVAAKNRRPATTWRNRQLNPTPERYKEIQQALVEKGYLKSEPTGVWDADSVSAMQHFQTDQKLTPTGKISAATLIGLGLGAKSAGAPEAAALPGATGAPAAP